MNANQYTGPIPLADRFWDKVEGNSAKECWIWTGSKTPKGYGRLNVNRIPTPAHRISYELLVGPIPTGLELDHLCRNASCVNPSHLEPVSSRENTMRGFGWAGTNARKTHCASGHEFSIENTRIITSPDRAPTRRCRACERRWANQYHAKKAAS